jgi:predicted DNA repair protein MutK
MEFEMASGLLALFDDVAAIVKIASASLDDVAKMAAKAGGKAAGIVIDDAAVTPRYVVGFSAERELPIILKIARGSTINKLVFLLPGALLLSTFAPWSIMPLLILGGAYLSYEGYGKVRDLILPATSPTPTTSATPMAAQPSGDATQLERERITSAIRTDFILSAEIMAITLATVGETSLAMKATVLAVVAVGITIAVYGTVALIVKADDFGVALARRKAPWSSIGRSLVRGMPSVLSTLSLVGTLAMLWVGGGIVLHCLAEYGLSGPEYGIKNIGAKAGALLPWAGGVIEWLVKASLAGVVGLAIGACVALVKTMVIARLRQKKVAKNTK